MYRWSNAENLGSVRFMVREKIHSHTDGHGEYISVFYPIPNEGKKKEKEKKKEKNNIHTLRRQTHCTGSKSSMNIKLNHHPNDRQKIKI